MVTLKKLDDSMQDMYFNFIKEWQGEIIPMAADIKLKTFEEYLIHLDTMENNPPRLLVPETLFFLVNETEIIGAISIRHFLNDGLLKSGGHIGYGVLNKYRGNNYAEFMVKNSLDFIKTLNLEKVLICCDENNIASSKTIQNCGGVLENTVAVVKNDKNVNMQRFWVEIK